MTTHTETIGVTVVIWISMLLLVMPAIVAKVAGDKTILFAYALTFPAAVFFIAVALDMAGILP